MVVHAYNHGTQEAEVEDLSSKASLGSRARPYLKSKQEIQNSFSLIS
jgi:hypothetical protein